jgi:hypothetical protein
MVPGRKERRVSHSTPDRSLPALSSLVLQLPLGHFTHELLEFTLGKVAANAAKAPRDLAPNFLLSKSLMLSRFGIGLDVCVFVGFQMNPHGGRDKVRQRTMRAAFAHQEQIISGIVSCHQRLAHTRHCIRSLDRVQSNRQQPDRFGHYSSLRPSGFHAKSKVAV